MKKCYQLMILAVPLLFFLAYICSVSAASGIAAYYIGPGEFYTTELNGAEKYITSNNTTYTIFIPVRTLAEHTGAPPDHIGAMLYGPVEDDETLTIIAAELDAIEGEIRAR